MKAEILTIGDELLRGEIVDSNKARIADRLLSLDIETHFHATVRDNPADMREVFLRASGRSDLVLVSGGLGPTRDDLTAQVLADTFGRKLVLDEPSLATLRGFFSRLGREMSENNAKQAYFPEGSDILANPLGTAPGFGIEAGKAVIYCMPGVPRELERMLDEEILPRVRKRLGGGTVVRATLLRTFGLGESTLDDELKDIAADGEVTLGFRTAFPDNYLRPLARAASLEEADAKLATVCETIRNRLGALVYAEGDQTMEAVVGELLRAQGKTVAVAESCSGGLLAERITSVPGASHYFLGGVVAYANAAKRELLGVPAEVLDSDGAVSDRTVRAMAEGVRRRLGADYGIATTGISGPDGGSEEKPLGLVHVALAQAGDTHAESFVFPLDRIRHRQLVAQVALDWLRRALLGVELLAPSIVRGRR